jgi:hypothetical protein
MYMKLPFLTNDTTAILEVLTAELLKIQAFLNVMLC